MSLKESIEALKFGKLALLCVLIVGTTTFFVGQSTIRKQSGQTAALGNTGQIPGRYQIVVNPEIRADTFLVDTQTGKIWTKVKYTDLKDDPAVWEPNDRVDNDAELMQWWNRHTPKQRESQLGTAQTVQP